MLQSPNEFKHLCREFFCATAILHSQSSILLGCGLTAPLALEL
jgi:hypothetical protein